MTRIDLTPIIEAFIALLVALVVRYVIPWIKGKTSEQDRKDLLKWIEIAVAAAQQTMYQMSGPDRKQYVLDFLAQRGFDIDSTEVDAAVEAAVLQLHTELDGGKQ